MTNVFVSTVRNMFAPMNLTSAVPMLACTRRSRTVHRKLPILKPVSVDDITANISTSWRSDYDYFLVKLWKNDVLFVPLLLLLSLLPLSLSLPCGPLLIWTCAVVMFVSRHTIVVDRNGNYGVTLHSRLLIGSLVTPTAVLWFLPRSCVPGHE